MGWKCDRMLREEKIETPILMLTALWFYRHDIVTGLKIGADDYLIKPFKV